MSDLGVALAGQKKELDASQWVEFLQGDAMAQLASHITGSKRFARVPVPCAAEAIVSERTSKVVGCLGEILEMALLTRLGVPARIFPQGTDVEVLTDRPFHLEVKTSIGTRKNSKWKYTAYVAKKQLDEAEEIHMWYLNQDSDLPRWELIAAPSAGFASAAAEFLPRQWFDESNPRVLAGWLASSTNGMAEFLLDHKVADPAGHVRNLVDRHQATPCTGA